MNTRVSIITGGGRGIGEAIAMRLAAETAVMLVGRTEADLERVCRAINDKGGVAHYVRGDVSDPQTAAACLAKAKELSLTPVNLILNAGIGHGGPAVGFDQVVFRQMFEVNVFGAYWFIQAFLPTLIENKSGTICLISSIAAVKAFKNQTAYCATKAALVGLAGALALEVAKHDIRVVPLCPSFVESDMTDRTIAGLVKHRKISQEEARRIVAETNPQKRIIPAAEVAEMTALICSGKVPSLNGRPIIMGGGE